METAWTRFRWTQDLTGMFENVWKYLCDLTYFARSQPIVHSRHLWASVENNSSCSTSKQFSWTFVLFFFSSEERRSFLFFLSVDLCFLSLTSGYKADRQNSPNGKHYLWLSSPFQRLGSVCCRLHSSPSYQRAWKTEHRCSLTHLLFTLMQ